MKKQSRGLTLIELIVVVAILGVLAAMLLPKFDGLQNAANHVAAGSSITDAAKLISGYKAAKTVFPDRWDSLQTSGALWTSGNAGNETKGLHTQLVDGTTAKLTLGTAITTTQVSVLRSAGITTLMNLTGTSGRPGDSFTTGVTISDSTRFAVINSSSASGMKIIDRIYRVNQMSGNVTGVRGAIASTITNPAGDSSAQLIVVGLGPMNALIPNSMMEAPTYGGANANFIYNRLLAVFELTSTKITFKAMLGADGDLLDDLTIHMQGSAL